MAKYAYPAIFTREDDGKYSVVFPDIENCFTGGNDMEDALDMAEDALCLMLYGMEEGGKAIPDASVQSDGAVSIVCDTDDYRYDIAM
jgi:predicted RNase H-like HicB family nuclease